MRPTLPVVLSASLLVSACATISESRFNPLNWFGSSQEVASSIPRNELRPLVLEGELTQVADARPLIAQITALRIERAPGGAIVVATGLAETQGFFNAQLVRRSLENGVLTLDFRAEAPTGFEAAGSEASRRITAATSLDRADLLGIRTVVVNGQNGSRRVSR